MLAEQALGPAAAAGAALAAAAGQGGNSSALVSWLNSDLGRVTHRAAGHAGGPSSSLAHSGYRGSLLASGADGPISVAPEPSDSTAYPQWPALLDAPSILHAAKEAQRGTSWIDPAQSGSRTCSASTVFGGAAEGWMRLRTAQSSLDLPPLGVAAGTRPAADGYALQHTARAVIARTRRAAPLDQEAARLWPQQAPDGLQIAVLAPG